MAAECLLGALIGIGCIGGYWRFTVWYSRRIRDEAIAAIIRDLTTKEA
jgi:hypothetical protein